MKVFAVDNQRKSIITPKTTGYAATLSLGGAILSGINKNKSLMKMHKPFAYLSAIFVALHIGLMASYRKKYKKM